MNEKPNDEKKPDINALLNQKETPKPMQIIPDPPKTKMQPNHPTGKIPNQLEAMWSNLETFAKEIKNAKSGMDFTINVLAQFGLIESKQKTKDGQPLWNVAKPLREPWLKINEIKDRVVNIEDELKNMKMDLTMLKQMILELKEGKLNND